MRRFIAAALAALAIVSCSLDKNDPIVEVVPAKKMVPLTIVASNPLDVETRTEMEGTTPYWSPGDALGVTSLSPDNGSISGGDELMANIHTRSGEWYRANLYQFGTEITERASSTSFTGEVAISPGEEESQTFYAFYPYPAMPECPSEPDYYEPENDEGTYYGLHGEELADEEAYEAAMNEYNRAWDAYWRAYEYYWQCEYYVYDNFLSSGVGSDGDEALACVYVRNTQHPTLTSFDGTADVLVSKPFSVTEETTTIENLDFARMTSVLKIVFIDNSSNHMFTGEHPDYVKVLAYDGSGIGGGEVEVRSSDSGFIYLAGTGLLNLKTPELVPADYRPYEASEEDYYAVVADYSDSHNFTVGANAVYLLVFPQQLDAGTTLQITLGESENIKRVSRTIQLQNSIALNPGKMTTLNISLFGRDNESMEIIAPESIQLDNHELTLEANGDRGILTAAILPEELGNYLDYYEWQNVQWTSSDESVVRVERVERSLSWVPYTVQANIIPVGEGTATVTVSYAGFTDVCEVTVNPGSPLIQFTEDQSVIKAICVSKWDTSGDGELSESEAAKVTSITSGSSGPFYGKKGFTSFPQFAYFTGLTELPDYLFFDTNLVSAVVPENVTSIGQQAFGCCNSLETVEFLGNKVTTIGDQCFRECYCLWKFVGPLATTDGRCLVKDGVLEVFLPGLPKDPDNSTAQFSLATYTIPNSVQAFGANPFYILRDSRYSLALTLPDGIESLPEKVFVLCAGLSSITFGSGLTSIGNQAFDRCTKLSSIQIPNTVTSIGNNAFYQCSSLTEVDIPGSVTSIGSSAFNYCSKLATINLHEGLQTIGSMAFSYTKISEISLPSTVTSFSSAFSYCSSLQSFTVPEQITTIENYAFQKCSSLSQIDFSSVETIGDYAFYYCSAITSLDNLPSSVTTVGNNAFEYCTGLTTVQVPETVTSLGGSVFRYCTNLTNVEILNDNLQTLGNNMFYNCYKLRSVRLPQNLTKIEQYAFYGCSALSELSVPSSVTTINYNAFNLSGLTTFAVPSGVTVIESRLFSECSKLQSVTIPASVTEIKSYAFSECGLLSSVQIATGSALTTVGNSAFYNCTALTGIDLPDSVTSIGSNAFERSGLTSFNVPAGVTKLPSNLFLNASSLTSIDIPDNVTSIGTYCFRYSGLTSVHIGSGVTTLEEKAFSYCQKLTTIDIPGTVRTIGPACFEYCTLLRNLTLGNGITKIDNYAFQHCEVLPSVNIPGSVTTLGYQTFWYCPKLKSVTLNEGLQSIGNECFRQAGLEYVEIPASVTSLGRGAFYCSAGSTTAKTLAKVRMRSLTPPTYQTGGSYTLFLAKDVNTFVIEIPSAGRSNYDGDSYWSNNWGSYFVNYDE